MRLANYILGIEKYYSSIFSIFLYCSRRIGNVVSVQTSTPDPPRNRPKKRTKQCEEIVLKHYIILQMSSPIKDNEKKLKHNSITVVSAAHTKHSNRSPKIVALAFYHTSHTNSWFNDSIY